jgi:hypothetical protein
MRTARAVGAETDTITGAPMAALFCTISNCAAEAKTFTCIEDAHNGRARYRTRKLVERFMTSNVRAQGNDAALETPERRGMNRARLDVEFLMHWQVLHGNHDLLRRELLPLLDNVRRTHGCCD